MIAPAASADSGHGATGAEGQGEAKVFVCKYVDKPGEGEVLQTGNNPISVSVNAIKGYEGVGSLFNDEHGRSLVIAEDNRTGGGQEGEPSVTISDCPASPVLPTEVTPVVNQNDVCGTANDTYDVVAEPTKFTSEATGTPADGTVSITFTALGGYAIAGPNPVVLTFTDDACPVLPTEVTPVVNQNDVCGTANDTYDVVAEPTKFTF